MDRELREFRIRGVKTNIPFLENVVDHPIFQSGDATTSFLDQTPELIDFQPRLDRATKLLTYLSDVIVNGNPEDAGKPRPAVIRNPPVPRSGAHAVPEGTRQLLDRMGPEKFAAWTTEHTRLLLTD